MQDFESNSYQVKSNIIIETFAQTFCEISIIMQKSILHKTLTIPDLGVYSTIANAEKELAKKRTDTVTRNCIYFLFCFGDLLLQTKKFTRNEICKL